MDKKDILLALAEGKQLQLLMHVYNYEQPEPDSFSHPKRTTIKHSYWEDRGEDAVLMHISNKYALEEGYTYRVKPEYLELEDFMDDVQIGMAQLLASYDPDSTDLRPVKTTLKSFFTNEANKIYIDVL